MNAIRTKIGNEITKYRDLCSRFLGLGSRMIKAIIQSVARDVNTCRKWQIKPRKANGRRYIGAHKTSQTFSSGSVVNR